MEKRVPVWIAAYPQFDLRRTKSTLPSGGLGLALVSPGTASWVPPTFEHEVLQDYFQQDGYAV